MNPLTKFRKAAGMTQYDLAEVAGCSQGRVSAIERGSDKPNPKEATRLSSHFGISLGRLFPNGLKDKRDYTKVGNWEQAEDDDDREALEVVACPGHFVVACPRCRVALHMNTNGTIPKRYIYECPVCTAQFMLAAVGANTSGPNKKVPRLAGQWRLDQPVEEARA